MKNFSYYYYKIVVQEFWKKLRNTLKGKWTYFYFGQFLLPYNSTILFICRFFDLTYRNVTLCHLHYDFRNLKLSQSPYFVILFTCGFFYFSPNWTLYFINRGANIFYYVFKPWLADKFLIFIYAQETFLITWLLPLISFLFLATLGKFIGRIGGPLIGIFSIFIAWINCFFWINKGFCFMNLGLWFNLGTLNIFWSFNFGSLTWIMCFIVTTVSLVVHFFSLFYMYKDPHIIRFYSYLNLFTFFMLFLLVSDNLLLIFFGWEGVGICSYLLINFWYTRIAANKSALKAVFINKISDIFLLYGIVLITLEFNTTELPVFFALIPFYQHTSIILFGFFFNLLHVIAFFLMLGAFGKSAQIGLHLWLPEAMEGPTPVSALIHAATMVTAGVFLIIRFSVLFENCPCILKIILFIGSITALLSSLIGSYQYDVKKIIAYSTCSQLGYMFVSCGLSHYTLSLFHLFNHAFFKALLFLSSGLIIHALNTQDIRHFEKKRNLNDYIINLFLIPSLSLCGLPFFSGAFSKELIISLSSTSYIFSGNFIYFCLISAAFLTSFYSIKLLYFITWQTKKKIGNDIIILKNKKSTISFDYKSSTLFNRKYLKFKSYFYKKFTFWWVFYPLTLLLYLSIFSGFIFQDIFLGIGSDFFSKDIYVNPIQQQRFFESCFENSLFFKKYFPLIFTFICFISFEYVNLILKKNINIYYFFKSKLYFDFIYNYILLYLKKISYNIIFQNLDKGLLEILGPNGVTRHCYLMLTSMEFFNRSFLFNYICLFLFLFSYSIIFF